MFEKTDIETLARHGAAILVLTIITLLIFLFTRHTRKTKTVYKEDDPTDILKETHYDWRGNKSHNQN